MSSAKPTGDTHFVIRMMSSTLVFGRDSGCRCLNGEFCTLWSLEQHAGKVEIACLAHLLQIAEGLQKVVD